VSGPGGFEDRIYDAFDVATPPAGSAVVRQAQVVQTYTEATGQHTDGTARGWAHDADPQIRRQAATAVVVSRAAVVVVLCTAVAAVVLAVLVRVLEWLA
jgi:hypothetical protein